MKGNKICPACNAMFESGASVCPNCGLEIPEMFLSREDKENWEINVLNLHKKKLNKEQGSETPIKKMKIFDGVNYTLALDDNKLYGFGNNQNCQISNESVSEYEKYHFIADNVISAAASRNYSVYVTKDGDVKIQGKGELAKHFAGFSGAAKVLATQDDQFVLISNNGEFYAFGNNINGQIKEKSTETVYCKYNIPFCHREDKTYSITTPYPYEKDKNSCWTNDDIIRLKTQYFSSRICGDEVYQKYREFTSSGDNYDIKWDINLNISSRGCFEGYEDPEIFDYYNDGTAYNRYYYIEYKGESSVVAYKLNNCITSAVLLKEEKIKNLLSNLTCADISEASFTDDRDEMRLFAGKDHFLVLNKGRLYGVGSNTCGQISDDATERHLNPHLMAEGVISAAASRDYSIYVTKNGEVKLHGNGEYTDRFPGFSNAKQVYATVDNTFFVVDNYGVMYGFGNNCHYDLQEKIHETLLSSSKKISDLPVTHLCTHTLTSSFALQNLDDIKKAFESVVYSLQSYSEFILKFGSNNINIVTNYLEASREGSNPSVPTVVKFDINYDNNHVYQPLLLTEKAEKNAILLIEKQNFQGPFTYKKDSVKKGLYDEYHKEGVFLNKTGRLAIRNDGKKEWCYAKKKFNDICDIAMITNTAGFINEYQTIVYIVSMKNGEIFIGCKDTLLYQSESFFGRVKEELEYVKEELEYGRLKRTIKIPE